MLGVMALDPAPGFVFPSIWRCVVTVLEDILEWSQDRPMWQRDALRRLVQNGELSDHDFRELTEICKGTHGLTEVRQDSAWRG